MRVSLRPPASSKGNCGARPSNSEPPAPSVRLRMALIRIIRPPREAPQRGLRNLSQPAPDANLPRKEAQTQPKAQLENTPKPVRIPGRPIDNRPQVANPMSL